MSNAAAGETGARLGRHLGTIATYLGAIVVVVVMAFPLYALVLTSVQLERDIRSRDVTFIPRYIETGHYEAVLSPGSIVPIPEAAGNSLLVSGIAAVVTVVIAVPATYALTRLRVPGRRLVLAGMVSIYVFPTLLFVPPLYIQSVHLGIYDTYLVVILLYVAFMLPFMIWILGPFLRAVPIEVEEAARVDGATRPQLLIRIVLPLMYPGIFAGLLLGFIFAWIEFLTPLLFTSEIKLLTVALGLYRSTYDIELGQLAAAAVVTLMPVALITVLFQRRIAGAITHSADQ